MLNKVKLLLGISDSSKDTLLDQLIDNASEFVRNYTHDDLSESVENVIVQMVIFNYNRLGTEGLQSESYSGVSFNYLTDYPDFIMSELKPLRKVRFY